MAAPRLSILEVQGLTFSSSANSGEYNDCVSYDLAGISNLVSMKYSGTAESLQSIHITSSALSHLRALGRLAELGSGKYRISYKLADEADEADIAA